jgi:hypothetical protein
MTERRGVILLFIVCGFIVSSGIFTGNPAQKVFAFFIAWFMVWSVLTLDEFYRQWKKLEALNDIENNMDDEECVYCVSCGNDEDLAFLANYANGEEWRCNCCGHQFLW